MGVSDDTQDVSAALAETSEKSPNGTSKKSDGLTESLINGTKNENDNTTDETDGKALIINESSFSNGPNDVSTTTSPDSVKTNGLQGIDVVYANLGNPGKFVIIQLLLSMSCTLTIAFPVLYYVFIGFIPSHQCTRLENETALLAEYNLDHDTSAGILYDKCNIYVVSNSSGQMSTVASMNCVNGHDFGAMTHTSFVAEWNLVCEQRTWLSEFIQSSLMIGQTIGALLIPPMADRFGRKPLFTICNALMVAVSLGAAYAPNLYTLLIIRIATGIIQQGTGITAWTLMMESVLPKYRRAVASIGGFFWNSSVVSLGLVAYLLRDYAWRALPIASAIAGVNCILYPVFLAESPRWLAANKQYGKCLAVIKRACKQNDKNFEQIKDIFEEHVVNQIEVNDKKDEPSANPTRHNILDLFKHKRLFGMSLLLWFIWTTNSLTYYGLFLVSSSLDGNRYLNFILMAVVDLPGDLLNFLLIDRIGRKRTMMMLLFLTGSSLLTASVLMAEGSGEITKTLGMVFSLVGKFGVGASFTLIFLYTPELFPTNIRTTGLGLCSSISRLGGMMAPYSKTLAEVVLWGPGAIFSGMCFLSAVMMSALPETMGRTLPTTIKDMKNITKGKKSLDRPKINVEIVIKPGNKPSQGN